MRQLKLLLLPIVILSFYYSSNIVAQRILPIGRNKNFKFTKLPNKKIVKRKPQTKKRVYHPQNIMQLNNGEPIDEGSNYNIDYNDNYEQHIIENETQNHKTNTDEDYFPYLDFPLRFTNAKIEYLKTIEKNNALQAEIYKMKIKLKVTKDDYFNPFAVMLEYAKGATQLEVFNEDEQFLYWNKNYTFEKEIEIQQQGFVNLQIGYYDIVRDRFYSEKSTTPKTNLLIYIKSH